MALHIFGAFITAMGTAANNRGITEGNTTTLQKLVWRGQVHSTVSAESIRFALRRRLADSEECNRTYDESSRTHDWRESDFKRWGEKAKEKPFIDDDLLGFMSAGGAKEEGTKGSAKVRRAVLEVTRAVSLTPWPGDVTFNAASPGATPSAQKKGNNPVPYATEMHATRYQYGMALTPQKLAVPARAQVALRGLCALGEVAGNHGRFLFDFSPDSVVFRITQDPAPRLLYSFESTSSDEISFPDLLRKVSSGDILGSELLIGGAIIGTLNEEQRTILRDARLFEGVRAACEETCGRVSQET